ncbi:MAG: GNAT family N-acetyltransferase [Lachnospiraceae bacterium]|nr:GNAT family N-acetyltransferase [Lachnospiraceae bacterium]
MKYTVERYNGQKRFNEQYPEIHDFLLSAADSGYNEHFHWGRFEWMMCHTMLEADQMDKIGIFRDETKQIAGIVTYDTEVSDSTYMIHSANDSELLNMMIEFALENYAENGECVLKLNSKDSCLSKIVAERGFKMIHKDDNVLEMDLSHMPEYTIPKEYAISPKGFGIDNWKWDVVIHKGFNHPGLPEKREKSQWIQPPNANSDLKVFALKDNEYCAHCGVWYTEGKTAYIEPVVTIPECRNKGLARAVVYEALIRARELGAKRGVVLSGQEFYFKIGFHTSSEFSSWMKPVYK